MRPKLSAPFSFFFVRALQSALFAVCCVFWVEWVVVWPPPLGIHTTGVGAVVFVTWMCCVLCLGCMPAAGTAGYSYYIAAYLFVV